MEQALIRTLAACALLGLATAAAGQPFKFVNPDGARVAIRKRVRVRRTRLPWRIRTALAAILRSLPERSQPFTFMNPNGYTLLTPGKSFGLAVTPPQPPLTRSYGDDN